MGYRVIQNPADVDLSRHALIEASAGTGKTYTIENLVVRLIRERPDLSMENILLVTFTEKATAELKVRIHEKLRRERLDCGPDEAAEAARIQEALDAFDAASIATIHGFCHSILQDFAFENGTLFENEVVDDAPIFDTLIREQMRKRWPRRYGVLFPELLQMGGFGAKKERFLSLVVRVARNLYRPEVGDRLLPDLEDREAADIRREAVSQAVSLLQRVGGPPLLSEGFSRLNIHGASKKKLLEQIVLPLETLRDRMDEVPFPLAATAETMNRIGTVASCGVQGIAALTAPEWLRRGPNPEACPQREAVVEEALRLEGTLVRLAHVVAVDTVRSLRADAARSKQQRGVVGYDDMLQRVHAALHGPGAQSLLERLRSRYRFAFVDEFQDTDPVQWRIFRRLFLEPSPPGGGGQLVLIGDPKQAIYSFRGADVFAYLEARNEMERLAGEGRARLYSLSANYRSAPELVSLFNRLFGRKEWFSPGSRSGPFDIEYRDCASPAASDLPLLPSADRTGRPVLNVVDLRGLSSTRAAKAVLARFVAGEILRLTAGGERMVLRTDAEERRELGFGDIGVLVRGKSEALAVEAELAERGIPYAFYKKPGLFQSEEALHLGIVFHAVADPGNPPALKKALLTPFFGWTCDDLVLAEPLPSAHPARRLLHRWHELAELRRWGPLFQSLLEDSGLAFREAAAPDSDRRFTNYRQIFEHLSFEAYRKNLDFRGLSARLDTYRRRTAAAEEDADIHQIETDEPRVQILTMHVSKGLQFPVVFIAGGLTRPPEDPVHVYHAFDENRPEAGARKVVDLARRSNPARHEKEREDEDKRLYYVALTRAQCKLYVPFLPSAGNHGWVGPVSRFLARALFSAFPPENSPDGVGWWTPAPAGTETLPEPAAERSGAGPPGPAGLPEPLLPPENDHRSRSVRLESFSSLHLRTAIALRNPKDRQEFRAERDRGKETDEGAPFREAGADRTFRSPEELPGGAAVGSMFHDILEGIDYAAVLRRPDSLLDAPETAGPILRTMEAYRLDAQWRHAVGRVVADVLTAVVAVNGRAFRLGDLPPEDRVHEVEFHYPCAASTDASKGLPECRVRPGRRGFVRGFVDLVFRVDGRFFIADWKSNRIAAGYGPEAVAAYMDEAGYTLQYKLYTVAVLRWLRQRLGSRFDPETHFGGVFYFFLRGMGAGENSGVFYADPVRVGRREQLEAEIATLLGESKRA